MSKPPAYHTEGPPAYSLYPEDKQVVCPPESAERLRRFLSFCLALDYGFHRETPDQLTMEDFCHFTSLAKRCRRSFSISRGKSLCWAGNVITDDPDIHAHLLVPAQALGIPGNAVLSMLRIFVGSVSIIFRGYHAYTNHLRRMYGLTTLARKLVFDRNELFAIVLPADSELLCLGIRAANLCYQYRYFEVLDEATFAWTLTLTGRCKLITGELHSGLQDRWMRFEQAWVDCQIACALALLWRLFARLSVLADKVYLVRRRAKGFIGVIGDSKESTKDIHTS